MFRFRISVILNIIWLAFVLNFNIILNRLEIAILIQPFVFVLAIGTLIAMMLVFKSYKVHTTFVLSTLVLLYAIGKVLLPVHQSYDTFIPTAVIEIILLVGTFFLARPMVEWLGNYNKRIKSAVFHPANTLMHKSHNNTAAIERKISLARRFGRELSLLYIPMSNRFHTVGDIKTLALQRQMSDLIDVLIGNSGLYTWHNGDLMVCLQGDAVNHVETIASQFSGVITDVLKMKVQIGIADFPRHGLILDDLIETAHVVLNQPSYATQTMPVVELFPKPPTRSAQTVSA